MLAICIEVSHLKGSGHLFRGLRLYRALCESGVECAMILNGDASAIEILRAHKVRYHIVDLRELEEHDSLRALVERFAIRLWINDRLSTSIEHAHLLRLLQVGSVHIDDIGPGAEFCDVNIGGLFHQMPLKGRRVIQGVEYLILSPELERKRKWRTEYSSLVAVSMGGADTYGVTLQIARYLTDSSIPVRYHLGPHFKWQTELTNLIKPADSVVGYVEDYFETMDQYGFVFTAGGVSPYELQAMGIPVGVISTEEYERGTGKYLAQQGGAVYLGHRDRIAFERVPPVQQYPEMSKLALKSVDTHGLDRLKPIIRELYEKGLCV